MLIIIMAESGGVFCYKKGKFPNKRFDFSIIPVFEELCFRIQLLRFCSVTGIQHRRLLAIVDIWQCTVSVTESLALKLVPVHRE